MKYRFLILMLASAFVLFGCGDDPGDFMQNDDDVIGETADDGEELPDSAKSDDENGNGGITDADKESEPDDGGKTGDGDNTNNDSGSGVPDNEPADDETDTDPDTGDSSDSQSDDADSADSGDTSDTDTSDSGDSADTSDTDTSDTDTNDTGADTDPGDTGSGEEEELTVVLPYNGGTVDKTIKLDTKISKIDVLLMVDLSSSMSAAHDNLKANVKTAILDGISAKIPDSAFGLVTLGFAETGTAYSLAKPVTTDLNSFRNAVDGIAKATGGSRTYHGLALWEAASGEGDKEYLILCNSTAVCNPPDYKIINISPVDCSGQEGTIGGACFRNNAMPIFVMASSQNFNNFTRKKFNDDYYDEWRESVNGNTYTLEKTAVKAAAKMNEINAKFIGISYKTNNPDNGFKSVATNTKSQDTTESANNFNISVEAGDDNFSSKIAEAVNNLAENIKLKVKAGFKHVDNEYGVENTVNFVKSFYPDSEKTVKAGTQLSIDPVTFENKFHENNDCEPHIFHITAEVSGEGLLLDSRDIKVIVPGKEDCGSEQH